jgi:hypothetical protein
MSQLKELLLKDGIGQFPGLYSKDEIDAINNAVDSVLAARATQHRAYVHVDELVELGLIGQVFSERMQNALFSIMPDPVLYHCHISEIAAKAKVSHAFGNTLRGWHRDIDSGFVKGDLTHFSIFVYLTDVGAEDGPFEFVPQVAPGTWVRSGTPYISVQQPAGFSFAWHRTYFHRASPNRGPVRRRIIKLSIQRNSFPSEHVTNPRFTKATSLLSGGDPRLDLLFGRYQGKAAPQLESVPEPAIVAIAANSTLDLPAKELAMAQLREDTLSLTKAREIKQYIQQNVLGKPAPGAVAYD